MTYNISGADIWVACQNIQSQRFNRYNLLGMIRRKKELTIIVRCKVDDFNAKGRVIQRRATAPLANACMPGASVFIYQVEYFLLRVTGFQITRVGNVWNQIVRTDLRAGQ
ncbi:hypothetical protein D3C80_1937880 [compost metagenome]